jgi:hypothetical protein
MIEVYFHFHRTKFVDDDGFGITPDWNGNVRGMESKSLKLLVGWLRRRAEEKNIEWVEEQAKKSFNAFLEKAYTIPFLKNSFLCCLLYKYRDQVASKRVDVSLSQMIREFWYKENPNYARDLDRDNFASDVIVGFLKQQFLQGGIEFSNKAALSSFQVIVNHIKGDDFWKDKTLRSIANNLQEFVNKIKSRNGRDAKATRESVGAEFKRRDYSRGGN